MGRGHDQSIDLQAGRFGFGQVDSMMGLYHESGHLLDDRGDTKLDGIR